MGSPDDEVDREDSEGPQTTVTLSMPFWPGETGVTQGQWMGVKGNNPSFFKRDSLPVERVSWHDAVAFGEKLNQDYGNTLPSGYHSTLPAETQWEYACRAGTTMRLYHGDDLPGRVRPGYGQLGQYAWCSLNSEGITHELGEKLPSAWGLHDMHGNVSEWCLDWFEQRYYGGSITDLAESLRGTEKVFCGGAWNDGAQLLSVGDPR